MADERESTSDVWEYLRALESGLESLSKRVEAIEEGWSQESSIDEAMINRAVKAQHELDVGLFATDGDLERKNAGLVVRLNDLEKKVEVLALREKTSRQTWEALSARIDGWERQKADVGLPRLFDKGEHCYLVGVDLDIHSVVKPFEWRLTEFYGFVTVEMCAVRDPGMTELWIHGDGVNYMLGLVRLPIYVAVLGRESAAAGGLIEDLKPGVEGVRMAVADVRRWGAKAR